MEINLKKAFKIYKYKKNKKVILKNKMHCCCLFIENEPN